RHADGWTPGFRGHRNPVLTGQHKRREKKLADQPVIVDGPFVVEAIRSDLNEALSLQLPNPGSHPVSRLSEERSQEPEIDETHQIRQVVVTGRAAFRPFQI